MRIHVKLWIENDRGKLLIGEGRSRIFEAIERCGSLSGAARELGMSYRALWGKVHTTQDRLGSKLVEGVAGGPGHGGTTLTSEAQDIMARFTELERRSTEAVERIFRDLFPEEINRRGRGA